MSTSRVLGSLAFALALSTSPGCAREDAASNDVPAEASGFDDPTVASDVPMSFDDDASDTFGLTERSAEGESILRLVNEASAEELSAPRGLALSVRVAAGIAVHRAGPDRLGGTLDDDPFTTLSELDLVPNVGRVVFGRLRGFVRAAPVVDTACAATDARSFPLELIVAPGPVEPRLLALLGRATRSIDVTIYQFTSRSIRTALEDAVRRGVRVRVILDGAQPENVALGQALRGAGIEVHSSSHAFVFTHQKTITIDEELTFVFSGNLETRAFTSSRNYGVVDRDFEDVRDFDTLFEADWIDGSASLPCTRLVYSPVTSRPRVLELLRGARRTIDVEAMYITDPEVVSALVQAEARGVAVRVLLNDPSTGFLSTAAVRALENAGAEVRRLPSLFIHAKVMVVDRAWLFLGSENFSANSLGRNREAGLVLGETDVDVLAALGVLEGDWQLGSAF